jgi:hypothetical protein
MPIVATALALMKARRPIMDSGGSESFMFILQRVSYITALLGTRDKELHPERLEELTDEIPGPELSRIMKA